MSLTYDPQLARGRAERDAQAHRMAVGFWDAAALLTPMLSFIKITMVGTLTGSEILAAALTPILLISRFGASLTRPLPLTLVTLCAVWLFSLVVSDFVNGSAPTQYLRGWARTLFFGLNLIFYFMLMADRWPRMILTLAGFAIGGLLTYVLNPSDYALFFPWKFGLGPYLTLLTVLGAGLIWNRGLTGRFAAAGAIMAIGVVSIMLGARSLGAITMMTAAFALLQNNPLVRGLGPAGAVLLVLFLALALFAVFQFYVYAVTAGWLGHYELIKYRIQSSGDLSILFAARNEFLGSLQAIADKPLLGHGSWPEDARYEIARMHSLMLAGARGALSLHSFDPTIPSHSHLLGAWVEAGVGGALIFIFLFGYLAQAGARLAVAPRFVPPVVFFVLVSVLWDILFSPLGLGSRMWTAIHIVTIITAARTFTQRAPAA